MPELEGVLIKVLLIEDDKDDYVLIRTLLSDIQSANYEITWTDTYERAISELRRGAYDACLLDYRLGERTGVEILQVLVGCPDKPPIIVLTSHGDYQVDIQAMKLGAADFLVKDLLSGPMLERAIRYAIDRGKSGKALRESGKQLDFLTSQLLLVQENERRRIAVELHDNLGQLLTAIKYNIETVINRMSPGEARANDLEPIIPLIQTAVENVRGMYTQLRPTVLDDLGVKAALTWFCREFEKSNNPIRVSKLFDVEEDEIPDDLKLPMFRIVQESMANIASHSHAGKVLLSLTNDWEALRLLVKDDGRGFNVQTAMANTDVDSGLGLRSIKRRAELSGGRIEIESAMDRGTTIKVTWPA